MTAWADRALACLRRLDGREAPVMAEIGVGFCKMAAEIMQRRRDLSLIMVDNFLAEEDQPERYRNTRDAFAQRHRETAQTHLKSARRFAERHGAVLIVADSIEAARRVDDGSLDMVFIDADHSYEGVKRDIAAWLPKVKRGGWLGGHDYRNTDPRFDFSGVDKAVEELALNFGLTVEADANFTWWVPR